MPALWTAHAGVDAGSARASEARAGQGHDMARPTVADLIVDFLSAVHEARIVRIVRYMESMPLSTPSGTTRNIISKLVQDGTIERVGYGRYRMRIDGQPAEGIAPSRMS